LRSRRRISSWALLRDDSGGVGLLKADDRCPCLDKQFGEPSGDKLSAKGRLCLDREDEPLGGDSCPWFSSTSLACERGNGKGEARGAEKHRFSFRGISGGFVSGERVGAAFAVENGGGVDIARCDGNEGGKNG